MQEKLVEFKTAKLAKEKGFNIICRNEYDTEFEIGELWHNEDFPFNVFTEGTFAPTQSLLQRWLRDVHDIVVDAPCIRFNSRKVKGYQYSMTFANYTSYHQLGNFNTYEEALEEGLLEALKLI